jgi:amino acid adenylation domain-containing protein
MKLSSGREYDQLLHSLRLERPWALALEEAGATSTPHLLERSDKTEAAVLFGGQDTGSRWIAITERIGQIAVSLPGHIAVSDGERALSYEQLERRAAAFARVLKARRVQRGDIVAVVLPRGVDFVIAMLAAWKIRAAFLPLSVESPASWRMQAARGAGAHVCVSSADDAIPGALHVNSPSQAVASGDLPEEAWGDEPQPHDLAYVIYTSGSTGQPKLVMIEHSGVANLAAVQEAQFRGLGPGAKVIQYSSLTFDGAVFDVILALGHGCRLEICDDASVHRIDFLLKEREITHAVLPAAVVRHLEPGQFPSLRLLVSVGDECRPQTAAAWSGQLDFVNGYGPTETCVCATLHAFRERDEYGVRVPIGRPVAGCHVALLDENFNAVPAGVVGEICIGGVGVGRGYINQRGATAAAFIPDAYSSASGSRLYRTGDLGKARRDGTVEFIGRRDAQVKIRGFRVDTTEIEAALTALPGVDDAIVVTQETPGGKQLSAYVLRTAGSTVDGDAIKAALQQGRPLYQIPNSILAVDHWPLTANGKVDRSKLLETPMPESGEFRAPRTASEELIGQIAADLLCLQRIGIDDDFFELGGNSLTAIQFVARIRTALGQEIPFAAFLENATISKLASILAPREDVNRMTQGPVAQPANDITPSFAQERAWFMHRLDPQSLAYNAQAAMRLHGTLDIDALQASLTSIIHRHDVLRSRFFEKDGELRCELLDPWTVELPLIDLSREPAERHAELVGSAAQKFVEAPFVLSKDHPARWLLIRVAEDEHVMVIVEHHTIHDGWSFNVFLSELFNGYVDYQRCRQSRRERPVVQYYDYAAWQRAWCLTPEADQSRRFWREALSGAPTLLQLSPRKAPKVRRFRGALPRLNIERKLALQLEALSRREGATLFITLLSAFFVLLHRYTGAQDMLVSSGVANRRWKSVENLIGMFVNTIVFRAEMRDNPAFCDLLRRIRKMSLVAYDHQELPFEEVLKEAAAARVPGVSPLVQCSFSFHDSPFAPLSAMPLEATALEGISNGSSKFDLHVIAIPRYAASGSISRTNGGALVIPASDGPVQASPRECLDGITMTWDYDTDLFDEQFVEGLLRTYRELLRAIVADVSMPVSELRLLSEETETTLRQLGAGPARQISDVGVHDLVEYWGARTPDAPAVVSTRETLVYGELIRQAREVALHLQSQEVGRGDIVAVLMHRSTLLIVALLGVLESGAAFLPLDPDSPEAHLDALLEESQSRAILSNSSVMAQMPMLGDNPAIPVIHMDQMGHQSGSLRPERIQSNDPAYVIYTSGSTGKPKGIVVEHRSAATRLAGLDFYRQAKAYLYLCAISFDVSVAEIFGPLVNGAAVHLPPSDWTLHSLSNFIRERDIKYLRFTTPLFHQFVSEAPAIFESLTCVRVGGDVLSADACRAALARGTQVTNSYGPTECTIFASEYTAGGPEDWPGGVPIGKPLPNTYYILLDDARNPVPRGALGEICIGGASVARGYHRMPRQTAERFIPDQWSGTKGARLFCSGDFGRWNAEGNLEFAGRRDAQVKIRGFLVEPAEVQAALQKLPAVADAIVVSRADASQERQLIAYIVVASGCAATSKDIRSALQSILPTHLVPSLVMIVDAWPLTPNGKVDREKLPQPSMQMSSEEKRAPTADEAILAGLMAELLGMERIGIYDNFFELGVTSLLIMRFIARVHTLFERELGLATVFANPSIALLAESDDFANALSYSGGGCTFARQAR